MIGIFLTLVFLALGGQMYMKSSLDEPTWGEYWLLYILAGLYLTGYMVNLYG